jgi:hypothetical protein
VREPHEHADAFGGRRMAAQECDPAGGKWMPPGRRCGGVATPELLPQARTGINPRDAPALSDR